MSRSKRLQTGQLRARFAAGLSAMYAAEVPAYGTLVEVCAQVNSDYLTRHRRAERLGSLQRVTAERHGAIRVGNPAELAAVADLFAAFGMLPVGYYDLRTAESPIPVVSTAFRPIDANELAHNPFRVFTSMLAIEDRRYFDADLRTRVQTFLARRQLFDPALLAQARAIAADGGCDADDAPAFVAAAVAAFALSREPVEKSWYDELSRVSAVAADIAGVGSTHINHLTPRVLDIDDLYRRMTERGITMIDTIQGPPRTDGPDVLLRQTSFRALAEPRMFRDEDGTVTPGILRVRFGEVEARGVALTREGANATKPRWRPQIRPRSGPLTFPRRMRRWPLKAWPTTEVVTRQRRSSTKTSCPLRPRASSAPTWIATRKPVTDPTMPATTSIGWPGQSADTFTTRMRSMTRSPRRSGADNH